MLQTQIPAIWTSKLSLFSSGPLYEQVVTDLSVITHVSTDIDCLGLSDKVSNILCENSFTHTYFSQFSGIIFDKCRVKNIYYKKSNSMLMIGTLANYYFGIIHLGSSDLNSTSGSISSIIDSKLTISSTNCKGS